MYDESHLLPLVTTPALLPRLPVPPLCSRYLPTPARAFDLSRPITELHLCPQRLVQKVVCELSRSSLSLWFSELDKREEEENSLLFYYRGWQEGSPEVPHVTPLPAWASLVCGEGESSAWGRGPSLADVFSSPVTSMPFPVLGGHGAAFAYVSLG